VQPITLAIALSPTGVVSLLLIPSHDFATLERPTLAHREPRQSLVRHNGQLESPNNRLTFAIDIATSSISVRVRVQSTAEQHPTTHATGTRPFQKQSPAIARPSLLRRR